MWAFIRHIAPTAFRAAHHALVRAYRSVLDAESIASQPSERIPALLRGIGTMATRLTMAAFFLSVSLGFRPPLRPCPLRAVFFHGLLFMFTAGKYAATTLLLSLGF